jgi:quinol-cytochrome oxidoreductase complex cytochrome b subunit
VAEQETQRKPSVSDKVTNNYVWRSIFRHGYADTPRNRVLQVAGNVWLHLHPSKVRRHAVRFRFTWCAGGLTFLLYLVTVVTGVVLMFYYRPTAEYAYWDVKYLDFDVPFGFLMRNMHRWAAHGMVLFIWLHMFRVFMTGSYKPPREFNWNVGVILLVLTLLLSFTGYLLPWDQLAIWAITVGSNMAKATPFMGAGGPFADFLQIGGVPLIHPGDDARFMLIGAKELGGTTLLRFYVLHCVALPLAASLLVSRPAGSRRKCRSVWTIRQCKQCSPC